MIIQQSWLFQGKPNINFQTYITLYNSSLCNNTLIQQQEHKQINTPKGLQVSKAQAWLHKMIIQTHTNTALGLHTESQQNESLILNTHFLAFS